MMDDKVASSGTWDADRGCFKVTLIIVIVFGCVTFVII